ncbi:hypothetical protein LO762_06600 [Actinocorallia sp. API 0066]|uniref:hypothetical protein n=1 Tax=Actinocorallia sp. API 0066 TaxID=2896846 RepID=UPI001E4DA571|nr:hypothetical protein [Actinocorallia sp. API 0066]MCD0448858.1 hypothetical protein [Actinocorallia sp. API 0066]
MSFTYEDFLEQQAEITSHLLFYLQAPFTESSYIRGVLPAPFPLQALRVVVGPPIGQDSESVIGHEIPLRDHAHDDFLTVQDVIDILRALQSTTQFVSNDQVSTIMGIRFFHADLATLKPTDPTPADRTLTVLRSLSFPYTEEEALNPRLHGFLSLNSDRLRLYVTTPDFPEVVAADIRPSGATIAALAALPSLLTEEHLKTTDPTDPHASQITDLTDW